jgi:predicted CXXCH cytochrome family protein
VDSLVKHVAATSSYRFSISAFLALCALVLMGVAGCSDRGHTILMPPQIEGAEVVGSAECATCHEDIVAGFAGATHHILDTPAEAGGSALGCEGCHGPGSLHVESGGGRRDIVNPQRASEACFGCHTDVRADFSLPHTHPVTTGPLGLTTSKIGCSDCHASHAGPAIAAGGTDARAENDLCVSCHPAQQGPYVFEHEALREGCTSCHFPHGSVNAVLLTERNATLCVKCHFQEQVAQGVILIGGRDHAAFLSQGTCWSAGCHEAVHGSQVSTSLKY